MQESDFKDVWQDMADMLNELPEDERVRFQNAIRQAVHDLRSSITIVYSAESLLRRSIPLTPENLELLDSIRVANRRALGLIAELVGPFDSQDTLQAKKSTPWKPVD